MQFAMSPRVTGGLLGGQGPNTGLLGQAMQAQQSRPVPHNTQGMMDEYLRNLFMRRYNPPAIAQQPGMVGSQMGQGGMQYMAPQLQQLAPPGKTEMQKMQEQLAAMQAQMQAQMQPQNQYSGDSGW